jgi:hypothetical protein
LVDQDFSNYDADAGWNVRRIPGHFPDIAAFRCSLDADQARMLQTGRPWCWASCLAHLARKLNGLKYNPAAMKTLLIPALALLTLSPLAANAQSGGQQTTKPQQWVQLTDSVGQVIGLREDQKAGWKALHEKWDKQAIPDSHDKAKHHDYIKLHNAREFDLKAFLTGGQYDRWRQLNKRSTGLGERENPPGTNMPPDR